MTDNVQSPGMSRKTAVRIEFGIIGLCLLAIVMIFQPFSKLAFTAGCILVVVGGLAFNLVPLCRPGRPLRSLLVGAAVVLVVFFVVVLLALGSAFLYGIYLTG
jgi:hypothetical protein